LSIELQYIYLFVVKVYLVTCRLRNNDAALLLVKVEVGEKRVFVEKIRLVSSSTLLEKYNM